MRGDYPTIRQVVRCAVELGINYFDTAPQYGDGQSEVNLGAVLRELGSDMLVGTKVRLTGEDMGQIGAAIIRSVEGSRRRLGRETIDLIQLHNRADVARAQRYTFLVEDGVVSNLVGAAVRFVVGKSGVSTALLGISSRDQLEQAVKYVERGPLSVDALGHIRATGSGPGWQQGAEGRHQLLFIRK